MIGCKFNVLEEISNGNLKQLANFFLEMWPESNFETEYKDYQEILSSADKTCLLAKHEDQFIGFVYVALRHDYV